MDERICKENVKLMYPNETNDRIISYMEIIVDALNTQYNGNIPSYLIIQLDLIYDLWKQYFKVKTELAKNDLFAHSKNNQRIYVNPALQMQQQLYQKIMDACRSLGVTLFDQKKVQLLNKKLGNQEEDAKDLLDKLIS